MREVFHDSVLHSGVRACVRAFMRACVRAYTYVCIHGLACVSVCVCVCVCVCVGVRVFVCVELCKHGVAACQHRENETPLWFLCLSALAEGKK